MLCAVHMHIYMYTVFTWYVCIFTMAEVGVVSNNNNTNTGNNICMFSLHSVFLKFFWRVKNNNVFYIIHFVSAYLMRLKPNL